MLSVVLSTWTSPMIIQGYLSPSRPNQSIVYRAYLEDELLCQVKCIYVYLAQRSEIVTQDFTEFSNSHHPVSKGSLVRWVKEVIENSDIDTEILQTS